MTMKTSLGVFLGALASVSLAATSDTVIAPASDGLVAVSSRSLDQLYLRPQAGLDGYRRIIIDQPRVELQKGWLKWMNSTRDVSRWLVPQDAQNITDEAGVAMTNAVAQAFRARGYEVVTEPGPGVLRLTPAVTELFVDAPYVPAPGIQVGITHDDSGTATLLLDARDAATGTLLSRVVDRDRAHTVQRFSVATGVSNLFWFEAMFSEWASNCAQEFKIARAAP